MFARVKLIQATNSVLFYFSSWRSKQKKSISSLNSFNTSETFPCNLVSLVLN